VNLHLSVSRPTRGRVVVGDRVRFTKACSSYPFCVDAQRDEDTGDFFYTGLGEREIGGRGAGVVSVALYSNLGQLERVGEYTHQLLDVRQGGGL
jgi:hypothetical protein